LVEVKKMMKMGKYRISVLSLYPIYFIMKLFDLTFVEDFRPTLDRIAQKKHALDAARPLPSSAILRVRDDLFLEWTYNSNAIEGNTLTLVETRIVLQDGITIGGKSLREHFEVINHNKAIDYLQELVDPNIQIRSIDLLHIHELVLKQIDDNFAGRIRNGMVRIQGANFTPPSPDKISDLIDDLISYSFDNPDSIDIGILAALFHHRFVWIHPFFDGNGRTGRLAMNLLLMRHGYPPAVILRHDRKKYYDALNHANKGNFSKIALMVLQAIERSLNLYLAIVPKMYSTDDDYEPLSSIANEPDIPYGIEYLSLLARSGRIDAYKEGRNWVTSKRAIKEYLIR
jgi:Fic family protein